VSLVLAPLSAVVRYRMGGEAAAGRRPNEGDSLRRIRYARETRGGHPMAGRTAQRIHTYCALCIARCGAVAVVEDGRFARLKPDPAHPTGQALCAKGRAAPELVYHRQRLTRPLRRTRPKGAADPGWQPIGWDEALDLTASAMRRAAERHGPQAVAFTVSSPSTTAIGDATGFIQRLANAFGTPNANITLDICGWGRGFATRYTYGVGSVATGGGGAMPDIENSGVLVLWGYNPSFTRLTHATAVIEAKKRGMRLIVVDPRHVGLAGKADLWLRVRPGSDGALALGIAHVMLERGWYDRDFIREWSNGPHLVRADTGRLLTEGDVTPGGDARRLFAWDMRAARLLPYDTATGRYAGDDANLALAGEYRIATATGTVLCHPAFELYRRLCRRYPPEAVERICWIPRARIEEAARLIWQARPASYYAWSGHEQHANVTQTARAMSLLYALTGCFDRRGGNVLFAAPPAASIAGESLPAARQMAPTLGLDERPLGPARWGYVTTRDLYRAIVEGQPYPVRAMIGFGANMLLAHADGARGRAALAQLEFYAHADLFMNPTAEMADVVLPVASAFEREGLKIGFEVSERAQSLIQLRPAVVPPPGEARPDTDIVFDLARRLGLGEAFWNGETDAAYRHQLAPTGVGLEELRAAPGGVHVPLATRYAKHAEPDATGAPRGFATPSRKVELYSQTFLEHGYAPLPEFVEPQIGPGARPDLLARFPLVLTSAKHALFCQTQFRALPSLRRRAPGPQVELHPAAAEPRGIKNGDWVSIETPAGSVHARAQLNAILDPRVVVGEHGWWQSCAEIGARGYDPFASDGANYNLLIGSTVLDPVSGTASHRAYLCEIRRAEPSGRREARGSSCRAAGEAGNEVSGATGRRLP
jgi:anaerobic selenocysteine-containing dehydrogenase